MNVRVQQDCSRIVGRNARIIRAEARMGLDESAFRARVSVDRLNALESGKVAVDGALLLRLATIYNASLDAFFEGTSNDIHAHEEVRVSNEAKAVIKNLLHKLVDDACTCGDLTTHSELS